MFSEFDRWGRVTNEAKWKTQQLLYLSEQVLQWDAPTISVSTANMLLEVLALCFGTPELYKPDRRMTMCCRQLAMNPISSLSFWQMW